MVQVHSYGPSLILDIANIGSLRQREGEDSYTNASTHSDVRANADSNSWTNTYAHTRQRASEDRGHNALERAAGDGRPSDRPDYSSGGGATEESGWHTRWQRGPVCQR